MTINRTPPVYTDDDLRASDRFPALDLDGSFAHMREPQRRGIDWLIVAVWTFAVAFGLAFWGALAWWLL